MAAGLPVITSPVGDAERIVVENQTGFVVAGAEVEAMAGRMVELGLSPATRARLGAAGRGRVEREYAYEALPSRLLSVFRDFAVQNRRHRLAMSLRNWCPTRHTNATAERLFMGQHAA